MLHYQKEQAHRGKKRTTRANNESQAARADATRRWHPVIVTGISPKDRRLITPSSYPLLDVDPAYQRGETNSVAGIVAALQAGGSIPDMPDLAERAWGPRDGKLWVLDGQQRICALQQLNQSFYANIHVSESLDAERKFFLAMNFRRALNSNTIVKAYNGPVTGLLKALNERPETGITGRIEFDKSGGDLLSASVMVFGIERLLSGSRAAGKVEKILSRTDGLLANSEEKLMATTFCKLVGAVFPKTYAPRLPVLALAETARDRWKAKGSKPAIPANGTLKRLQAINWKTALPGNGASYQDYANAIVGKCWKK